MPPQPSETAKILGQQIVRCREFRRWDQAELARRAGTSPTTLSSIENGKTSTNLALIERIAEALEVEPWALLQKPLSKDEIVARFPKNLPEEMEKVRKEMDLERLEHRLERIERRLMQPEERANVNDFAESMMTAHLAEVLPEQRARAEKARYLIALFGRLSEKQLNRYTGMLEAELGIDEEEKAKIKRASL